MVAQAPPLAGRREWLGLAVLALPTLLLALDLSVLYLALPHLSADLHASSVEQLWITDIYGFLVAGFLVTMGTLGDRIGRRRLLMIGAACFAVASVAAAFSRSPEMLIAARAALGIAGATLAPSTLALITTMFSDPKQRATAMGAYMSCFVVGNAIGPVVGGLLLSAFWWGSVFLIAVPVMLVLVIAGPRLLPEFKAPAGGRFDVLSVVLWLVAILPVVYGLKQLARHGWQPVPVVALVAGLVLGVVFVLRQRRLADPLLDLRLFGNRSFSAILTMMFAGGIFLGGVTLLVTQYLQLVAALSPLGAALWQLPAIVAMTMTAMSAAGFARTIRPARLIAAGMVVSAAGYVLLTQVASGSLTMLVIGWTLVLGGAGLPAGLGLGVLFGSVPPEQAGSASSVHQTSTEFGLALGIAVVGSIAGEAYRSHLPAGAPAAVRDNLAAALRAAPDFAAPAREAYTGGLHLAAVIGAVVMVVLAVVTGVLLRHIPAFGTPPPGGAAEPSGTELEMTV